MALNLLEILANHFACSIVAVHTHDAHAATQIDPQISSRFRPFELPRWKDEDAAAEFART